MQAPFASGTRANLYGPLHTMDAVTTRGPVQLSFMSAIGASGAPPWTCGAAAGLYNNNRGEVSQSGQGLAQDSRAVQHWLFSANPANPAAAAANTGDTANLPLIQPYTLDGSNGPDPCDFDDVSQVLSSASLGTTGGGILAAATSDATATSAALPAPVPAFDDDAQKMPTIMLPVIDETLYDLDLLGLESLIDGAGDIPEVTGFVGATGSDVKVQVDESMVADKNYMNESDDSGGGSVYNCRGDDVAQESAAGPSYTSGDFVKIQDSDGDSTSTTPSRKIRKRKPRARKPPRQVTLPMDVPGAAELNERELEGLTSLLRRSTKWSARELLIYTTLMKKHGDTVVALEAVTAALKADPLCNKVRSLVFSYQSNWNRRYPPFIEWLNAPEPRPGPLKQLATIKYKHQNSAEEKTIRRERQPSLGKCGQRSGEDMSTSPSRSPTPAEYVTMTAEQLAEANAVVGTKDEDADVPVASEERLELIPLTIHSLSALPLPPASHGTTPTLADMLAEDVSGSGVGTASTKRSRRKPVIPADLVTICGWLRHNGGQGDPRLRSLDLGNRPISTHGFRLLANSLTRNVHLRELHLHNTDMGSAGLAVLAEALETNRHLAAIDLTGNAVGAESVRLLVRLLQRSPAITSLFLDPTEAPKHTMRSIQHHLRPAERERLWLEQVGLIPMHAQQRIGPCVGLSCVSSASCGYGDRQQRSASAAPERERSPAPVRYPTTKNEPEMTVLPESIGMMPPGGGGGRAATPRRQKSCTTIFIQRCGDPAATPREFRGQLAVRAELKCSTLKITEISRTPKKRGIIKGHFVSFWRPYNQPLPPRCPLTLMPPDTPEAEAIEIVIDISDRKRAAVDPMPAANGGPDPSSPYQQPGSHKRPRIE